MNDHKGIITVGEFLTRGNALAKVASSYTGPVLVVTGDKDLYVFLCLSLMMYLSLTIQSVECGGNCFQSLNGSANLLEPARSFFPGASDFEIFIPADTGHCLHAHFSAPHAYEVIHKWVAKHTQRLQVSLAP